MKQSTKFNYDENGNVIDLVDEEVTRLAKLYIAHFEWCECYPNCKMDIVKMIIREWFLQKKDIILAMMKHPNYNGDYAIEFDKPIRRSIDKDVVTNFLDSCRCYSDNLMTPYLIDGESYGSLRRLISKNEEKQISAGILVEDYPEVNSIIDDLGNKWKSYQALKDKFVEKWDNGDLYKSNYQMYENEEYFKHRKAQEIFGFLRNNVNQFINEASERYINERFPDFKAKEGQKVSRVVNKLCKMLGIDKVTWNWIDEHDFYVMDNVNMEDNAYNYKFAKFADAINPFCVDKHIFISVHPIEAFLTMSWGTNWSSCHTTDKENKHRWGSESGASYRGCYSSGCESYMLDNSSVTMYILGKNAINDAIEKGEPSPRKEMRQMFHLGKEKFIQGRLYPYDQTDKDHYAEPEDYVQYREIVQTTLSEIWEVPNLWTNKRGSSECEIWEYSNGTNYPDYEHYNNVNISFLKDFTDSSKIYIGESPICPMCGERHTNSDNTFCEDCLDENDSREIYCDYHDRYERLDEDSIYEIEGYGTVCEDALQNGDFRYCAHCNHYYYDPDGDNCSVESIRDGVHFCCESCATNHGYIYVDRYDDYIDEEELEYSEIDQCYYLSSDNDCVNAIYDIEREWYSIALRENCVYYNGEYYSEDVCILDVNDHLIPETETVIIDFETYAKADCIEYNEQWYLPNVCIDVDGTMVPINMTEMEELDDVA